MHTSVLSLEAAGLVERSARNQRVVLVRPTKRGRQCLEAATRRVARWSTPRWQISAARTSGPYERGWPAWRP